MIYYVRTLVISQSCLL